MLAANSTCFRMSFSVIDMLHTSTSRRPAAGASTAAGLSRPFPSARSTYHAPRQLIQTDRVPLFVALVAQHPQPVTLAE
jgi:hypothetical protein